MTEKAPDLDDKRAVEALDKSGVLKATVSFDEQCAEAAAIARAAAIDVDSSKVANIIVLGMGGSGISGDVSRVLFDGELRVPLTVNRNYNLPAFAGPDTLAIAVSYSGNTEETLSAFEEALGLGAQGVVISSGGKISDLARSKGISLITIPAGLQPRAALAYLSMPLAVVLERLGLVGDLTPALNETMALAKELAAMCGPDAPKAENPAKRLAERLFGKMAVIYGSEGITGLAAFRFKCQLNENSKSAAHWNVLPELDHNEITGWQELSDISRRFRLIFLRDGEEHPQVAKRVDVTRDLIKDEFEGTEEVWSRGESKLARLFSLILFGDFVSIYLALLNGIDPSPVERIELLKKRLVS